jgi:hypothetical protein
VAVTGGKMDGGRGRQEVRGRLSSGVQKRGGGGHGARHECGLRRRSGSISVPSSMANNAC